MMATSAVGVVKMGNNVRRVGIEPTSLAMRARVLPHILLLVTTIPMATCLGSSLPQRSVQTNTIVCICVYVICLYV